MFPSKRIIRQCWLGLNNVLINPLKQTKAIPCRLLDTDFKFHNSILTGLKCVWMNCHQAQISYHPSECQFGTLAQRRYLCTHTYYRTPETTFLTFLWRHLAPCCCVQTDRKVQLWFHIVHLLCVTGVHSTGHNSVLMWMIPSNFVWIWLDCELMCIINNLRLI